MRLLVACERYGRVRDAFRARGHDAISCDLEPTVTPGPHIQGDVIPLLHERWDLVIAFPPCTHLACSGARHFQAKRQSGKQQDAIGFFLLFAELDCPTAIENPVGIMSTWWRPPDQVIHPWHFGDPESKATCLWLHKLPPLRSESLFAQTITRFPKRNRWENQTASGQNKLGPSPGRAAERGKTYPGIATAMAAQWG